MNNEQRERIKVLGAGIFSLILVLGVARFSYTPLLPLMQQQAGLGVAEAGWLAAINYAGYLSGAFPRYNFTNCLLESGRTEPDLAAGVSPTKVH